MSPWTFQHGNGSMQPTGHAWLVGVFGGCCGVTTGTSGDVVVSRQGLRGMLWCHDRDFGSAPDTESWKYSNSRITSTAVRRRPDGSFELYCHAYFVHERSAQNRDGRGQRLPEDWSSNPVHGVARCPWWTSSCDSGPSSRSIQTPLPQNCSSPLF